MGEQNPDDDKKRILKLDDLLRERRAPEPADLTIAVKELRAEVQSLHVRQDLLAGRQQQAFGMMDATKKLVKEVWDWMRSFEAFVHGQFTRRSNARVAFATRIPSGGLDLIERFTAQHVQILYNAEQFALALSHESMLLPGAHDKALLSLQRLAQHVDDHFRVEDNVFNDNLKEHRDDEVHELLQRHMGEVGGLRQIFSEFCLRWNTVDVLDNDPTLFVHDAMVVLDMLAYRISQEDTALFPLIEKSWAAMKPEQRDF